MVNRRVELLLAALLILLVVGVSIYEYYPIYEQQQTLTLLRQSRAYDPHFNYELFASVDVNTLPKPSGQWTYKDLVVNYTWDSGILKITYVSGPACPTDFAVAKLIKIFQSDYWYLQRSVNPSNCHQSLLILSPPSNLTVGPGVGEWMYSQTMSYEAPGLSVLLLPDNLPSHVYLFLVTYPNYQPPTPDQRQASQFLDQEMVDAMSQGVVPIYTNPFPYDPLDFRYTQILSVNVQALDDHNGTMTSGNVTVSYTFARGGAYGPENRPVFVYKVNYLTPCVNVASMSLYCRESILLIGNNNVTDRTTVYSGVYVLSFQPGDEWGSGSPWTPKQLPLYTNDGHYIDWHLYLFLATYTA